MDERERIRTEHPLIQRVTGGRGMLLFSLPFLGSGVLVGLVGLRVVEVDPATVHAPYWVLTAVGAIFAVAGLAILAWAVRGLRYRARRETMRRRRPGQPWLADWPWDPRVARDEPWRRVLHAWFGFGLFALFLAPFVWWAFLSGEGPWVVKGIVGLFLLVTALVGYEAGRRTLQALRYGAPYARLDAFPFRLGEELRVRFGPCPAGAVRFVLECVEERYETRGTGRNRKRTNVMDRLWRAEQVVDLPANTPEADVRFALPDAPELTTDLSAPPIRYWRLRATADVPGVDLDALLLLPVYATDAAPAPRPRAPLPA